MIGIDAVDLDRFRRTMARSPELEERLFSPSERAHCHAHPDPVRHLAGTLAAKEAVIKAGRLGSLVQWGRRIEIERDASGAPRARVSGIRHEPIAVSISHDGPVAVAVAFSTPAFGRSGEDRKRPDPDEHPPDDLRPNRQLLRFMGFDSAPPIYPSLIDAVSLFAGTDFP